MDVNFIECSNKTVVTVDSENLGFRIDLFLSNKTHLSRSAVSNLIKLGYVFFNSKCIRDKSLILKHTGEIHIFEPVPELINIEKSNIGVNVIYQDENFMIVDKPIGMVSHPGCGTGNDTLIHALMNDYEHKFSPINGRIKPGLVHRLDKDTGGLLVVAVNQNAYEILVEMMRNREIKREYKAVVWGKVAEKEGCIEMKLLKSKQRVIVSEKFGRLTRTFYTTIERFGSIASFLECRLETGMTHQIRVHFSQFGHSLIGDQTYGKNSKKASLVNSDLIKASIGQALHAFRLSFQNPFNGSYVSFESQLPRNMISLIEELRNITSA